MSTRYLINSIWYSEYPALSGIMSILVLSDTLGFQYNLIGTSYVVYDGGVWSICYAQTKCICYVIEYDN